MFLPRHQLLRFLSLGLKEPQREEHLSSTTVYGTTKPMGTTSSFKLEYFLNLTSPQLSQWATLINSRFRPEMHSASVIFLMKSQFCKQRNP